MRAMRAPLATLVALGTLVLGTGTAAVLTAQQPTFDLLIRNGRIVDGTGNPWYRADIAITGDRIRAVGSLPAATAKTVINREDFGLTWNAALETGGVLVGKDVIPPKAGHDKTGLVVFQRADEPGSLISILQEFAARRINLSNLLSRPTKRGGLGDYCFIMYADGHIEDELVADALRELHAKQGSVKFLGSYPAAGAHAYSAREHADARWREADDWVNELRSRIAR